MTRRDHYAVARALYEVRQTPGLAALGAEWVLDEVVSALAEVFDEAETFDREDFEEVCREG